MKEWSRQVVQEIEECSKVPRTTIEEVVEEIMYQITALKHKRKNASYVILDSTTFNMLITSKNRRSFMWYGYEQKEPGNADRLCGLEIAILNGTNTKQVIEVRE